MRCPQGITLNPANGMAHPISSGDAILSQNTHVGKVATTLLRRFDGDTASASEFIAIVATVNFIGCKWKKKQEGRKLLG
jgi:hypothetical protein